MGSPITTAESRPRFVLFLKERQHRNGERLAGDRVKRETDPVANTKILELWAHDELHEEIIRVVRQAHVDLKSVHGFVSDISVIVVDPRGRQVYPQLP